MNRSLKWSVLMALALGSSQIVAQGSGQGSSLDLGQIQVKSALGQPLLAEIPLRSADPAELRQLTVQLASGEDFARAGIAASRTKVPLHFSVVDVGNGNKVIRITSSVAVDDPYLDLLLQLNEKTGKSVREYTILLDPPGMLTTQPPVMTHAAPRQDVVPAAAKPATPVAAKPVAAKPASAAARAGVSDGRYGPVERGQTLSTIARDTALSGTNVNQMMLALKQANPDAFYRDNINALKSGVVLRIPTAAEAQALEAAAANAQVRRENSDWRAGVTPTPTVVADAATRQSTSSAPTGGTADKSDRLALVPPVKGDKAAAGHAAGDGKSSSAIQQDLMRSQEALAALQQQSADLKSRLKELSDINDKNRQLLSLKDNEIAELQAKLAAARKGTAVPAVTAKPPLAAMETPAGAASLHVAPVAAASAAQVKVATVATAGTTAAVAPAGTAPVAIAPARTEPAKAKPAAVKPLAKPSPASAATVEQPWYMQPRTWAAGAGVAVLLLLLGLLGRRKKPVKPAASASSLADRFEASAAADYGADDTDQNELLDQLAEHPDDISLHLELVSLYYSRRDVEHFEAAAEAMHAHVADPQQEEWQDVVHMGEDLVPGHPLFANHEETSADDATEFRPAFDIDHYGDEPEATVPVAAPPQPPKKVSEYNFNFQLTQAATDLGAATHHTEIEPAASAQADDELPPLPVAEPEPEPVSSWQFDTPESEDSPDLHADDLGAGELGEFSDDPVDTKLDLARAYLDMGDADGARAMLDEVLKEGTQMQKDVAERLYANLP